MKRRFPNRLFLRFMAVSAVLLLVATTIYVSAASRRADLPGVTALDVEDSAQVRETLTFNPFEPQQAGASAAGLEEGADTPAGDDGQAVEDTTGQSVEEARQAAAGDTPDDISQNAPSADAAAQTPTAEGIFNTLASPPADSLALAGAVVGVPNPPAANTANVAPQKRGGFRGFLASKWGPVALIGAGLGAAAGISIPIIASSGGGHGRSARSPSSP